jgi:AbrB family looped-hinge helix DNA binding protein
MKMPRVTQKGQVTIPQSIRDQFSFHPGTEVQFQVRENAVILLKANAENKFLNWLGKGKRGKKQDVDGMIDQLRGRTDE